MKNRKLFAFTLAFLATMALTSSPLRAIAGAPGCDEDKAYDRGFNQALKGEAMDTDFSDCSQASALTGLREAYRKGYKEGLTAKPESKTPTVQVVIKEHEAPAAPNRPKCSDYRQDHGNCFMDYDGEKRGRCQVCRESKSCFMALDSSLRGFCQAYQEKVSCFMAFNNKFDRSWCEHLAGGKSCEEALQGVDREKCLRGELPAEHYFWRN